MYSSSLSEGFEYLHSKQIIHCDFCCSNVLIDRKNAVKISDFGLAIVYSNNDDINCIRNKLTSSRQNSKQFQTKIRIKWTAPESLNGNNFTFKSDVWSYSIFLWELWYELNNSNLFFLTELNNLKLIGRLVVFHILE